MANRKTVKLDQRTAELLGRAKAKILTMDPGNTSVSDDETIAAALEIFLK